MFLSLIRLYFRVKLSQKNQAHGKAWGRMVWRGRPKEKDERIGGPLKHQWSLVRLPDYAKFSGSRDDLEKIIVESRVDGIEIPPKVNTNTN